MALDVYKEWLGIPEGPRPPDHYALLRLKQFDDEIDRIRSNYKKLNGLARKYATGQYLEESQALLNELAKAMLCLTDQERKREYDESLGREFPEEELGPRTIDQVLISQKHITRDQAQQAKEYSEQSGLELRDALVQLKMVPAEIASQALAVEQGLSYVDLTDMVPDDDVMDVVPRKVVRQYSILPLFLDNGTLLVACVHQIDHMVEEELRLRFDGAPVRSVLTSKGMLDEAIAKYYAAGMRTEPAAKAAAATQAKKSSEKQPAKGEKTEKPAPAPKAPPKSRKIEPKSEEELRKNKQLAIIAVCWSVVAAYLLDSYVITPRIFLDLWTFVLFAILPAITYGVCWGTLLKK
ncbi:MAG: general secretion pathway protein GspE [Planctomycetota bacterium]|nr:general secretion pathway protein GspE [Planctomycetota bacterium]